MVVENNVAVRLGRIQLQLVLVQNHVGNALFDGKISARVGTNEKAFLDVNVKENAVQVRLQGIAQRGTILGEFFGQLGQSNSLLLTLRLELLARLAQRLVIYFGQNALDHAAVKGRFLFHQGPHFDGERVAFRGSGVVSSK